jgi:hypothetical protein
MSLIGLDVNASRARAVAGPRSQALSQLCLDGDRVELSMALSLEEKQPIVGRAGLALTRLRPHTACLDFLPHLGMARTWSAGRHQLDADRALAFALDALARSLGRATGLVLALPVYLSEEQVALVHRLTEAARLRLLGSVSSPLAAALAAFQEDNDSSPEVVGRWLVVDVDGHALTWSVVERESGLLHLGLCQTSSHLGKAAWLRKLLDGVANRCVRQSRRDPRESAETEQALHEQLAQALQAPAAGLVQLRIQGHQWYHHLMLAPDDLANFSSSLLRQARADLEVVLSTMEPAGGLAGAFLTAEAAGLPGLLPALQERLEGVTRPPQVDEEADYGDLMLSALNRPQAVRVLRPEAVASAAHEVAVRIHRGEVLPGHLESVPLSLGRAEPPEIDPGPARLSFRGRDHFLSAAPFTLGRDPACDLVFESELYPHVSARHCEIVYDRRAYTLRDRSRHGTLLNDRRIEQQAALHSGDWIRLGPHGPVLRFLGQPAALGR